MEFKEGRKEGKNVADNSEPNKQQERRTPYIKEGTHKKRDAASRTEKRQKKAKQKAKSVCTTMSILAFIKNCTKKRRCPPSPVRQQLQGGEGDSRGEWRGLALHRGEEAAAEEEGPGAGFFFKDWGGGPPTHPEGAPTPDEGSGGPTQIPTSPPQGSKL